VSRILKFGAVDGPVNRMSRAVARRVDLALLDAIDAPPQRVTNEIINRNIALR